MKFAIKSESTTPPGVLNQHTVYPLLTGNFEPENGCFNRDFEGFSVLTSKVPNFNTLSGALFGKMTSSI